MAKTLLHGSGLAFHSTPLEDMLVSYCSPTVLTMGISLLLLCLKIERPLSATWMMRLRHLGGATYCMYIANVSPAVWTWRANRYIFLSELGPIRLIGGTLLCALIEYLALMAFGLLVDGLIRKLQFKLHFDRFENRLKTKIDL